MNFSTKVENITIVSCNLYIANHNSIPIEIILLILPGVV